MFLFEWDEAKAASNLRKHGVTFEQATNVFYDPDSVAEPERIEDGEVRWQTIGLADGVVLLLVAHTVREAGDEELIRIIMARPATRKERARYGENRQEDIG